MTKKTTNDLYNLNRTIGKIASIKYAKSTPTEKFYLSRR